MEAGHRVSLPTPCDEVSDLISMAPGGQEATFLSEDEHEEGESSMARVADKVPLEVPSSVRRSSISITDKSNRGNSSDSVDTRVLFSSFLSSQENWGNETCDRSLYSEKLPFGSPFQNGDQQIYQSLYSSRYVDHQTGPFG